MYAAGAGMGQGMGDSASVTDNVQAVIFSLKIVVDRNLHIVKLDEAGYFLSTVPVALGVWWMVGLNLLFIAVIIGVVYLATSIIQRIDVADAIKYN